MKSGAEIAGIIAAEKTRSAVGRLLMDRFPDVGIIGK
jgi:hypothetical protein